MAVNKETPTWYEGIYQLEENDSPFGGFGGTTNIQFVQLACRTRYLFELLRNIYAASTSGRSIASWRVTKTIPADTIVKLPIEYVVGARSLMLFSDITGEIGPKYYSELGIYDKMSDSVKFTFEIPAGAVLTAVSLATSVDKIVYDGTYKYQFAWTDLYQLYGMAATDGAPTNVHYRCYSKYEADIADDLGIARVVDAEDSFGNISEQTSTIEVAPAFNDTVDTSEEFGFTLFSNKTRTREDVDFTDKCGMPDDLWEAYTDVSLSDKYKATCSDNFELEVTRKGITEKIFELNDEYTKPITDTLRCITNRNLAFDEEYTDEMDSLKVHGEAVASFSDVSTGALEKSLVLSIDTLSSGDSIFLKDIYAGADDNDLVVIASKK